MARITGTSGDDRGAKTLNGTNQADEIFGLAGNDTLIGFDGDDVLEGGSGADELFGSDGFDYASYRGSGAGRLYRSSDQPRPSAATPQGDTLYDIEGVIGSGLQRPSLGNDERNVLRGEGGNDLARGVAATTCSTAVAATTCWWAGPAPTSCAAMPASTLAYGATSAQAVTDRPRLRQGLRRRREGDRLFSIEDVFGSELQRPPLGQWRGQPAHGAPARTPWSGGGGADRFVYRAPTTAPSAAPDRILDFSRSQGDRIDLVEHRRQRAGRRRPGVPVHRQGAVHRRGSAALVPAERRHDHRGQHDRRHRRGGAEDRARPAGLRCRPRTSSSPHRLGADSDRAKSTRGCTAVDRLRHARSGGPQGRPRIVGAPRRSRRASWRRRYSVSAPATK